VPRSIRLTPRARAPLVLAAFAAAFAAPTAAAEPLPRVASINVCTDQHLLALADPEQILTVSWLAADPEESLMASEARRYTLNYGTAEELLKFAPDASIADI
jgi:iron complex transport system substrate-binding protein